MSGLPDPIRETLDTDVDEVAIHRMWRNIDARRTPGKQRPFARVGIAAIAAAALFFVGLRVWRGSSEVGPLYLASGESFSTIETPASLSRATETHFADGSAVALSAGAHLEPIENNDHAVTLLLSRGRAFFDVRHGGPRRWAIESGLATVEVVGTRFRIDRTDTHLRVTVYRGIVLVKGERVPNRIARLLAGEHVDVYASQSPRVESVVVPVAPPTSVVATETVEPAHLVVHAEPRWHSLAARGDYRQAYDALGHEGLAREVVRASAAELLALADVARLSGHPQDAVAPLDRLLAENARDPHASIATFTLGRISIDSLHNADQAARAFSRCLELGPPAGLVEDAYARLVEAYSRGGHAGEAAAVASTYRLRLPDGRRTADIARWSPP